jgi:arsenate reductase
MAKWKVLVLCTGNSARSQLAEAIINARRGDTWQAVSAGTHPAERVHPAALAALAEIGITVNDAHPKHVNEFTGRAFDLIVTVCDDAAENCPVWPGQGKRVHLGFPDPAKTQGTEDEIRAAFRKTRDDIAQKILPLLDGEARRKE